MNETKKCPMCHLDIPSKAKKCPNCHTDLRSWVQKHPVGTIALFFIFISFVVIVSLSTEEINSQVPATVPPKETISLGAYVVDSEEFNYMDSKEIRLFRSYTDRTVLASVKKGETVELLQIDSNNDYCKVKTINAKTGWFMCGWLKDLAY